MSNDLLEVVGKVIAETKSEIEKKIEAVSKQPGPQGEPGRDADPAVVAELVVEKYADQLRGADGKDAEAVEVPIDDVAEALKRDEELEEFSPGDYERLCSEAQGRATETAG